MVVEVPLVLGTLAVVTGGGLPFVSLGFFGLSMFFSKLRQGRVEHGGAAEMFVNGVNLVFVYSSKRVVIVT